MKKPSLTRPDSSGQGIEAGGTKQKRGGQFLHGRKENHHGAGDETTRTGVPSPQKGPEGRAAEPRAASSKCGLIWSRVARRFPQPAQEQERVGKDQ